jgi:hypothetical protein
MAARTTGTPPSANGASSFHLGWVLAGEFDAVSVSLEVLEPPTVPRLYFWALQADMAGPTGRAGGAHLGLQWHPQYPGSTAVNWGGYHATGGELHGSESTLPSVLGNPNTRNLAWSVGRPHRLRIERVDDAGIPEGWVAWRGSVEDLVDGSRVVVRDLYMPGDRIVGVTMWSEVFARCAETGDGAVVPVAWAVNYQSHRDGGCANTDSSTDAVGAVQRTSVPRSTPHGTRVRVPTR